MDFVKSSLENWEELVKKQLKTDDFYTILQKENLEGIIIKPYYQNDNKINLLPKVEESTHLVANFQDEIQEHSFAFIVRENIDYLKEKVIFVEDYNLLKSIELDSSNKYFSLVDVFSDDKKAILNKEIVDDLIDVKLERSVCVDVSLHQNAGASIIQQLAIALAKTKDLVEQFGSKILEKLIFRFANGSQYFLEIAKIRAFKYLFNQFSKEYNKNLIPYIFVETSFRNKSKIDAENNLIRSTLELASAMISGADAVFSNDYKLVDKSELSNEISFKQQIVLAYESLINVFEDATSGSYFVEDITQQFADKAWQLFLTIEEKGGYLEMLKSGEIQSLISEHAQKEQSWVEEGKIKIIGVNLYPQLEKQKSIKDLYNLDEIKPIRLAEMFDA